MFGTCGIRKIYSSYDKSERTFTPSIALRLGLALGTVLGKDKNKTVVIGRDVRKPSLAIQLALTSGLMSSGCKVFTINVVSTPTLCMSIDYLNADCGVMITASHNPPEYIGIKLFNKGGLGFSPEQEQEVEKIYQNRAFNSKAWNEQGSVAEVQRINNTHIRKILRLTKYENHAIRNRKYIIDPGNGSASIIGPMLINNMGLRYITLNSQPDGTFPGRLSEPSKKNLFDLCKFIKLSNDVDVGIAFDGDADRVVFVNENGVIVEPIRVLTFLAREYIQKNFPDKTSRKNLSVVTPVNSSGVIEHILEPMGVQVHRTKVGDINVSIAMQKFGSFLGGENCGVYIWPEFAGHQGPDTLMAIAILLQFLGKYEKSFSELFEDIPIFPYIQRELHLVHDRIFGDEDYRKFAELIIPELEKAGYHNFRKNLIDGLHIRFDEGWVLVRKSGTTPIMRLTGESKTNLSETEKIIKIAQEVISSLIEIKKQ
ncbi:phosphoglucosamine mutase [Promethearchaeum syntrophicum]|uniref:Phosphoglucosamine mutase n=1 Tax=Promethearchaeum syntrophicum TaxID=2594042 RepID=A0A5B9DCI7_9ARCH|nr:phosphoglucosamine mutase [Candidatus Prometheoarchaeum syntrophicum]QEE16470.1 putative phosphoglucosamine mutase [Candidatus Prometheoarchaeum syntrophicum]